MAIHIERTVNINASPERVWAVMVDVERWPEWTESMKSVERLGSWEFGVGSRAKLRIRRSPNANVWTVTELTPNRSFTWRTNSGGVKGVAAHIIEPDGNGSKVTLTVDLSGIVATLFGPMIGGQSRKNVEMEAEGLKRRSEEGASAPGTPGGEA
jgi:carbon monoxide dehydrogenase subunit G